MTLENVLAGVPVVKMVHKEPWQGSHSPAVTIRGISHDSRRVAPGEVYIALRGERADGHRFIPEAVRNGAVAVVVEDDSALTDAFFLHEGVVKIVVGNARQTMARMAGNLYGNPSRDFMLVGVTGTNGKTTTTHLIRSILQAAGLKVGLLGTMGHHDGTREITTEHTTPESNEINRLLAGMRANGCQAVVMEVSSHALAFDRVHGLRFSGGVFTNLTQDHLDFHRTMDEYGAAKKRLFDGLDGKSVAATNIDDPFGRKIVADSAARLLTYGTTQDADVKGEQIDATLNGTVVTIRHQGGTTEVRSSLAGLFNASNILAAFTVCAGLDLPEEAIRKGIALLKAVRGRFETIRSEKGWTAVVDYAHTPDALERALQSIRTLTKEQGRVITVFGCGGNRDRGKRPLMGSIASKLSDLTVLTSDNPRLEDPEQILDEIAAGVAPGVAVHRDSDRRKAIAWALTEAQAGDVVLIAGKGHETYQIVGAVKVHLDDREEVLNFIRSPQWN